ncbi:MAG TPA: HAD family hydrolase [Steroidobacteraceae bacterium]|nr:HAD family hydrolase [Steroidobacteraceae bacterium]
MRYLALCTDYDGTLATDGRVLPETESALERLLASGRRLVLVTGRELDDLQKVCPRLDLFEYVVAENGALLYQPSTDEETPLAPPPPEAFVTLLRQRGVGPISVGRVIVATWEPHESTVLATIRDLGLELQVIFNKGAVMILPAGVNKATGLASALEKMELSPHNAVGIGDAENDHALLALCECSAAVANALPTLKGAADLVTAGDHGAGVVELIEELLRDDLASLEPRLERHNVLLGTDDQGNEIHIRPHGETLLVVGADGAGKSELATGLMEKLAAASYSFCVIDVEGDYGTVAKAVSLGSPSRPPTANEILKLLRGAGQSAVVNLSGLPASDRRPFLMDLTPKLAELRARSGRPHWVVVDETHDLLPANEASGELLPLGDGESVLHITERPNLVTREVLRATSLFIALGASAQTLLDEFCQVSGLERPVTRFAPPKKGEALAWRPASPNARPVRLNIAAPQHGRAAAGAASGVGKTGIERPARARTGPLH